MDKNKVKYNLKNVHWATQEEDADGVITFGTPSAWPGAVSLTMSAKGDTTEFYADGILYYTDSTNNGYEGDMESALLPEEFETQILNNTLDDNQVMTESSNGKTRKFALMFEFDGDTKSTRHVLYNCTAARPEISGKTTESTKEIQTDKLTIKNSPLANGNVRSKTTVNTPADVFDAWYESVYVPVGATT